MIKSMDEIIRLIHNGSVRKQMVKKFRELCGDTPSDNTMGWALQEISNMRFNSKISDIKFPGKSLHNHNVSFRKS